MSEKRFKTLTIIIEDGFGTATTSIRSELSAPQLMDKIFELKEENEQLKQFKQNVFGLIDKSLEKDKHDYEMTYEDYLNGRIEVLEDLKKELLE